MAEMKMIVGLGNPGKKYAETRHNIGFKVIDSLSETLTIDIKKKKFGAKFAEGQFDFYKLILLKPWQFMNCSGQVVATAVGFYRLALENLLIVTDDMALEPGTIRLRTKGSAGGHNGLTDIIDKLGTENINRLRIGIGWSGDTPSVDYVLTGPSREQKPLLDDAIEKAKDAVICWIEKGIEQAMTKFNCCNKPPEDQKI